MEFLEKKTSSLKIEGNSFNFGLPEIDPNEVELQNEIGFGSFGKVYRGRCRQKPVAIKILHKLDLDPKALVDFRREIRNMSRIFHPNICLFMGACTAPGNYFIVTELISKGNLEGLLHHSDESISLFLGIRMARDAALGMNWLHSSNPVFIHRDLKPSNLLVDENMRVKVCDFGLSQLIPRDKKVKDRSSAKGTPLYMAPEVMAFREFNESCDVYSFGIVLWEIVARERPYQQFSSLDEFKTAICQFQERPDIPLDCHPSLRELIEICWNHEPNGRPPFRDIISFLDNILVDLAIQDQSGQDFWKKYFLGSDSFIDIPWGDFENALKKEFYPNIVTNEMISLNFKCLHAMLVNSTKENLNVDYVNIQSFGKLIDWFGPFEARMLDKVQLMLRKGYFHGDIGPEEAQSKLGSQEPGFFLVRLSSTHPGTFTISSMDKDGITHRRVIYSAKDGGFVYNNTIYATMDDLLRDDPTSFVSHCLGSKYQYLFMNSTSSFGYEDRPT